jgi:hypothetical protein
MISLLLIGALGFAVFSLGQAMFAMARGPDASGAVVRALTRRIAISVLLFVFLLVGWKFGLLQPHGIS